MARHAYIYLIVLIMLLASITGCGLFNGDPPGNEETPGPEPDPNNEEPDPGADSNLVRHQNASGDGYFYRLAALPVSIQQWVDLAAKEVFLGQSRVIGDYLYILVTYGPKPTGGYTVEITEVQAGEQEIRVDVEFTKPKPGDLVTQAFTYPFDLVVVPADGLPVVFNAHGAETYVMGLYGLDTLEPITASSYGIKLFAPADGDLLNGALIYRGVASVFEGTVNYRLRDEGGQILTEGFTTAGMGDWYYFEGEIPLTGFIQEPRPVIFELFTISPKDGSEQDKISLKLNVEP